VKRPLLLAVAALCAGCTDALLGPAAPDTRPAVFDQLWQEFDLHYSFFEYKNVNWDSLRAEYRPLALSAETDQQFADAIAAMMRQLKDVHVSLTPAAAGSTMGYLSPYDTISTYFSSAFVFEHYVTGAAYTSGLHMHYGWAAPQVGYVHIPTFEGSAWDTEMDEVIDSLPGATSLIIDIRNNNGGNNPLAIAVAGRFTGTSREYGYVRLRNGPSHDDFTDYIEEDVAPAGAAHFRGAVYVLTNRRDFSSAEDFVLATRVIPRVTIVGDSTAGASGGPIVRELANGWSYELSEWIEYTPNKKMFEGVGLAPDVEVKAAASDAAKGLDAALATALGLAQKKN
jgi:carboxyl-terminal processing protease